MNEADAEIKVVGAVCRGGAGALEVEERFARLGRAVILVSCHDTNAANDV